MAFHLKKCLHCIHQREVNYVSMDNIYCSYWGHPESGQHSCNKFSPFPNLKKNHASK